MSRDVLPRHLRHHPLLDPEEAEDPAQGPGRGVDQLAVAEDQHLLARDHREQEFQLLPIPAQPGVMPERGPAGADAPWFLGAGLDEVPDRFQPGRPQVGPVGVGPFHRIAQHRNQLRVRDRGPDAPHRVPVVQVQRRRLTPQRPRRGRVEQRLVIRPPPHVLAVGERVAGSAARRRRPLTEEEFRLFDR
jgi:hypothetical protein